MRLRHPFEWLSDIDQKRVFGLLVFFLLVAFGVISWLNAPLETNEAPLGIISLELAGTLARAQEIVLSWRGDGHIYAALSIGFDYLFLVLYSCTIALGCALLAKKLRLRSTAMAVAGVALAWLMLAAGLMDSIENYGLIQILLGTSNNSWPTLVRWLAIPKFIIVILAVGYLLLGLTIITFSKSRKSGQY